LGVRYSTVAAVGDKRAGNFTGNRNYSVVDSGDNIS